MGSPPRGLKWFGAPSTSKPARNPSEAGEKVAERGSDNPVSVPASGPPRRGDRGPGLGQLTSSAIRPCGDLRACGRGPPAASRGMRSPTYRSNAAGAIAIAFPRACPALSFNRPAEIKLAHLAACALARFGLNSIARSASANLPSVRGRKKEAPRRCFWSSIAARLVIRQQEADATPIEITAQLTTLESAAAAHLRLMVW